MKYKDPSSYYLMSHTAMELRDPETIRVWKYGSEEPDINTYAAVKDLSLATCLPVIPLKT